MLGMIGVVMLVVGGAGLLLTWLGVEQMQQLPVPWMGYVILAAVGGGLTLFFRRPSD